MVTRICAPLQSKYGKTPRLDSYYVGLWMQEAITIWAGSFVRLELCATLSVIVG